MTSDARVPTDGTYGPNPDHDLWSFPKSSDKMVSMVATEGTADDWQRLAVYVTRRRLELDLTQTKVQAAGGPSVATIRSIENAESTSYRASVLHRLETVLCWEHGSINAILRGGEPTPTHTSGSKPATIGDLEKALLAIAANPNRPQDRK